MLLYIIVTEYQAIHILLIIFEQWHSKYLLLINVGVVSSTWVCMGEVNYENGYFIRSQRTGQ